MSEQPQEVKPNLEGKSKAKAKPQVGDPQGYNPGGERVMITAATVKSGIRYNDLHFDVDLASNLSHAFARKANPRQIRLFQADADDIPLFTLRFCRMLNLLIGKQLTSSMPQSSSHVSGLYSMFSAFSINAPVGILPLIRTLGTVEHPEGNWKIVGHPIVTSTSFLRALGREVEQVAGVNQQVDFYQSIGLDATMPNLWQYLVEYCAGVVNQFCNRNDLTCMDNGGNTFRVRGPKLLSGFTTFFAAFQPTNFPPHVLRAFGAGSIAERLAALPVPPLGNQIAAADVQALNAVGYVLFQWNSADKNARLATYSSLYDAPLREVGDSLFLMTEVTVLANKGSVSQISMRYDAENTHASRKLIGTEAELGSMLSTPKSGSDCRNDTFNLECDKTQLDQLNVWIDGMMRGKNKQVI